MVKDLANLSPADFERHPVWEYVGADDCLVSPYTRRPVTDMSNKMVATKVVLASGKSVWALLGLIDLASSERTSHFLLATIYREDRRFTLARYFDVDYSERGPSALAAFMECLEEEIFPIRYDISDVATGDPDCVVGKIPSGVTEIDEDALIRLAIGSAEHRS